MYEADKNKNDQIESDEFDSWARLGAFDIILAGVETPSLPINSDSQVVIDHSDVNWSARQIQEVTSIIAALGQGNTVEALVLAYGLLAGSNTSAIDPALLLAISNLVAAISNENINSAVGQVLSIVTTFVLTDSTNTVSEQTTAAISALVTSILNDNTSDTEQQVFVIVVGLLTDLSSLTRESATAFATIVRTVIRGEGSTLSPEDTLNTLTTIAALVTGIREDARAAIVALIIAIQGGNDAKITNQLFIIFEGILGAANETGAASSAAVTAILRAVIDQNRTEAVIQVQTLYNILSNGGTCSSR